jgi:hypothetical protein
MMDPRPRPLIMAIKQWPSLPMNEWMSLSA